MFMICHIKESRFPAPKRRQAAARATAFRERSFGCAETALTPSPARATAFRERFFGCAETALTPSPALDGIKMSARSLWYRSLRSTYPPGTGGSPSAPLSKLASFSILT